MCNCSTAKVERLFIALALPDPIKAPLVGLAEPISGIAWTCPEQLHLTLRFLGDVPVGQIDRIGKRLAAVCVEPFLLPVEGLDSFP